MKKSLIFKDNNHLINLLKKGVEEGVFSGAALGVYFYSPKGEKKEIICQGKTRYDEKGIPVYEKTFFDLASLTKPLCTVLLFLYLIENKKIGFDTTIDKFYRTETPLNLKKIKIKDILSHSSGLKAYEPFFVSFPAKQDEGNKGKIVNEILKIHKKYQPGEKCIYSDLGYILLGDIVEKVTEIKLDELFSSLLAKPMGVEKEVKFRSLDKVSNKADKDIAATQYCLWRKRLLQGEVDDEHCWLMNGIAGHAGLFGTIDGVLDMCTYILHQWKERKKTPAYSNEILRKALQQQYTDRSWCLGFDTPTQPGSSGGKYLSAKSVGHLGFTGTSFWIDLEKELVIVLLTNRIHPSRDNERIKNFRPMLHDAVITSLFE